MKKKTKNSIKPIECWAPIGFDGQIRLSEHRNLTARSKPPTRPVPVMDYVRVRITIVKPKRKAAKK